MLLIDFQVNGLGAAGGPGLSATTRERSSHFRFGLIVSLGIVQNRGRNLELTKARPASTSGEVALFGVYRSFFFFRVHSALCLGSSKLAKSCEKTPLFGCLMVTALPGPAALRTLWLPHGNGFALVLFFFPLNHQ